VDDAYITFRYAQNIIDGQGMVYNPGERVLGTTTPIYTFLMTIVGSIFGGVNAPFPWIALFVNTLADVLTTLLLIRLGENLGYQKAGYATAIIWSIAPMSVTFAIGGMETSFTFIQATR
jgi:4-amino-4-deoxy-L-arabinose transferase-like glycosyltransferase